MCSRFGAPVVLLIGALGLVACGQAVNSAPSTSAVVIATSDPSVASSASPPSSEAPSTASSSAEACVPSAQVDLLLDNFDSIDKLSTADLKAIVASFAALDLSSDAVLADWRDRLVANLESGNQNGMGALSSELTQGLVGLGGVTC